MNLKVVFTLEEQSQNKSKFFTPPVILMLGTVFILGWFAFMMGLPKKELPKFGGEFTLHSANGPVSLSDHKGKVVLLYFGFTHCANICPTTLTRMSKIMKKLDQERIDQFQPIFISVDHRRDTPEKLKKYASFFSKKIIGLTGNKEEIDKVTKQYGVFYKYHKEVNSKLEFTVDHTSRFFLIDQKGRFVDTMEDKVDVSVAAKRINKLLQSGRNLAYR
jgi:protein SCO1/2